MKKSLKRVLALMLALLMLPTLPLAFAADETPSIPTNAVVYNGHSYYIYPGTDAETWDDAKAYCESLGGYLAVISSAEENAFLTDLAFSMGTGSVYIGYSDAEKEGDWKWVADEGGAYTNWATWPGGGEPNNANNNEHYAEITGTDDKWYDITVKTCNRFICEWAVQETADGETPNIPKTAAVFNEHSYFVYSGDTAGTPAAAIAKCEALGGYLAVISSAEENAFLTDLIFSQGTSAAYFGFSDAETEGVWKWLGGEDSTYTNWDSGEPNNYSSGEDYANIEKTSGKWNDNSWSTASRFICEWASVRDDYEPSEVPMGYTPVNDAWDLYYIHDTLNGKFILMNDIDLTELTAQGGDFDNNGHGWAPIGENNSTPFTGIFDGNGHTIKGLRIEGIETNYAGLFGYLKGTVKNLVLEDVSISGSKDYMGAVTGYCNGGTISGVRVSGAILNTKNYNNISIGGISGAITNSGTITGCGNEAAITGTECPCACVGGVCGYADRSASISQCFNAGTVSGRFSVGGILGEGYSGYSGSDYYLTISDCYNVAQINSTASGDFAAGICGKQRSASTSIGTVVSRCLNYGTVSGSAQKQMAILCNESGPKKVSDCYYLRGTATAGVSGQTDTQATAISLSEALSKRQQTYGKLDFTSIWFFDDTTGVEHPQLRAMPEYVTHEHHYIDTVTAPTCTKQGYTTHTCSCGDSYVDTYVDELGHDFGKWATTTAPTCTEKGEEKRYCSRCDAFESREVDATGHKYVVVVIPPTCTEQGYTTHTCACGDSYVDTYVNALGHDFGEWKTTTAPTCTEKGEEKHTCSRCDAFETRDVDATGHHYTAVVTAPTCTEQGYTTHTCACGDSYVDIYVKELGHDFEEWTTTVDPTCTDKGEETRWCSRCDAFETREINATGHHYTAVITPPTCTEQGYTTHTCACGDSYVDTYVNALGHKEGNWVVTKQPTVKEEGVRTLYCSECGEILRTEPIAKLTAGRVKNVTVGDVSLNAKAKTTLKPQITADADVNYTVSYSSSNTNVAKVNERTGEVTAAKKGTATITCTVTDEFDNTVTDTCKVTVNYTWWQWIIVIVLFGWIWY